MCDYRRQLTIHLMRCHQSFNIFTKVTAMKKNSVLNKWVLAQLICITSMGATFAAPYIISADGQEVTDVKTSLIWRRCSEGMTASANSCAGAANRYTHEAALTSASTQTGWRLPSVSELSSIADKSRINPAIDVVAFPATPSDYFWSSSPHVGRPSETWIVVFGQATIFPITRSLTGYVRLVRTAQ
jgi:Protein of unknown function (DUF1566)